MARRTTGHPILPIDIFGDLLEKFGEDAADEILDRVQEGGMSIDDAEAILRRDDIDPEDWPKFEEGWRPKKW